MGTSVDNSKFPNRFLIIVDPASLQNLALIMARTIAKLATIRVLTIGLQISPTKSSFGIAALNLRDIFGFTTIVAAYLGLRHAAITFEGEMLIAYGLLGIGITVSIYSVIRDLKTIHLFLLPALVTLLLGSSYALERVYESPGTLYLRKHRIQAPYVSDPQLNLIGVIVGTVLVTVIAGTIGFAFKLLYDWAKRRRCTQRHLDVPS